MTGDATVPVAVGVAALAVACSLCAPGVLFKSVARGEAELAGSWRAWGFVDTACGDVGCATVGEVGFTVMGAGL